MKGLKNEVENRLKNYNWEWVLVGLQLITFGTAIWYNALHDRMLHPIFIEASEPVWVYVPFIVGFLAVYIGLGKKVNPFLVKFVIYALTLYWAIMTYLLLANDSFNGHISIIATVTWAIVPKIWLMAWRANFTKDGVEL